MQKNFNSNMNDKIPSLKLWGYAFGLVFLIAGILFVLVFIDDMNPNRFSNQSLHDFEEAIKKNYNQSSKISILIFGSSLSRNAFANPDVLENNLSKILKKEVAVLKIAIGSLNMDRAEQSNFFNLVRQYPPDYLFIENNNLNIDYRDRSQQKESFNNSLDLLIGNKLPVLIHLKLKNIKFYLKNIIGIKSSEIMEFLPPSDPFYSNNIDTSKYKTYFLKKGFIRHFSQNGIANKAYEDLNKKNSKVIFLHLPISSALDSAYLSNNDRIKMEQLLNYYSYKYNIETWNYPEYLSDSCFSDGAHLNYIGARKFDAWFLNKISAKK